MVIRSQQRSSALRLFFVAAAVLTTAVTTAFTPRPRASVGVGFKSILASFATTTRCQAFVNNNENNKRGVTTSKDARSSSSTGRTSPSTKGTDASQFIKPFWDQQHHQQHAETGKVTDSKISSATKRNLLDRASFLEVKQHAETPSPVVGFEHQSHLDSDKFVLSVVVALLVTTVGVAAAASNVGWSGVAGLDVDSAVAAVQHVAANPQAALQAVVDGVQAMGPAGALYFGVFYLVAELLAVPATPLTMSAGYLFGLTQGVGIVVTAATIAACIAFFVGKTFLRSWVEGILAENPKFRKLDTAIGEQGFKLLILLRLSPIFPFSLSNYVYGASSIGFAAYFWGTLLGFTPGTIAYVYTGMVGKELMLGSDGIRHWYVYAAGFFALLAFLKLVTDIASGIVEAIDDDGEAAP